MSRAYIPVGDDSGSQDSNTLVCFAYPRNKFKDSPTFEAATFSVAEVTQVTKTSALSAKLSRPARGVGSRSHKKLAS
jgi:hypothetical protein